MKPLSTRARNAIADWVNVKDGFGTPYKRGKAPLDPSIIAERVNYEKLASTLNCGPFTIAEISEWLNEQGFELKGMPKPKEQKLCPHCGKPIALSYRDNKLTLAKAVD
jgi:hypothetical protein